MNRAPAADPPAAAPAPRRRPNLVLVLCDDLGYSDLGCYGGEIATPRLDRLAAAGLRFSRFYNCARCCPSRAALLTGLYPHQAGVGHMVGDHGVPAYQGFLDERCVTLAEALRPAGYRCFHAGKWHVGGSWPRVDRSQWTLDHPRKPLPKDRGFDRWYGCPGGGNYFYVTPLIDHDRIVESDAGFYTTDRYTDAAIRMVEGAVAEDRPFFLHLCYNAPHWPLHAPPGDVERYRGRYAPGWDHFRAARREAQCAAGLLDPRWPLSPRDPRAPAWADATDPAWQAMRMAVYAAQVDRMDRNVGRLMDRLAELGVADDTVFLFLSDNGGSAEELAPGGVTREVTRLPDGREVRVGNIPGLEPGPATTFMSYGLPWANVSNTPFRRHKSWVHEGGISTPAILHWPAGLRSRGIAHETAHFVDVAPTLLELAGATCPAERGARPTTPLAGESFAPLLRGERWRRQAPVFWEHQGNRAVRHGDWKLVSARPGEWELYHMGEDRTELRDRAAAEPGRVAELAGLYGDWAARSGVLPWGERGPVIPRPAG